MFHVRVDFKSEKTAQSSFFLPSRRPAPAREATAATAASAVLTVPPPNPVPGEEGLRSGFAVRVLPFLSVPFLSVPFLSVPVSVGAVLVGAVFVGTVFVGAVFIGHGAAAGRSAGRARACGRNIGGGVRNGFIRSVRSAGAGRGGRLDRGGNRADQSGRDGRRCEHKDQHKQCCKDFSHEKHLSFRWEWENQ